MVVVSFTIWKVSLTHFYTEWIFCEARKVHHHSGWGLNSPGLVVIVVWTALDGAVRVLAVTSRSAHSQLSREELVGHVHYAPGQEWSENINKHSTFSSGSWAEIVKVFISKQKLKYLLLIPIDLEKAHKDQPTPISVQEWNRCLHAMIHDAQFSLSRW